MATLDFEEILGRVVEVAQEVTGARYGALGIYDERRRTLSRFISRGVDETTADAIGDLPRGYGVLGELLEHPVALRLKGHRQPSELIRVSVRTSADALVPRGADHRP